MALDLTRTAQVPPNQRNLCEAATHGDLERVKHLIEVEDVDQDWSDEKDGTVALHGAALKGYTEIVAYLLSKGAIVDVPNMTEGQTPLHWACIGGHLTTARQLLSAGADITIVDNRGYNALHHSVQYGHVILTLFCLEQGLGVDSRDEEGHTSLSWAAYQDKIECLALLLDKGAEMDAVDNVGATALHWAATRGNANSAAALLRQGANWSLKDTDGQTALDIAVKKKNTYVAAELERYAHGRAVTAVEYLKFERNWRFIAGFGMPITVLLMAVLPFLLSLVAVVVMWVAVYFAFRKYWPSGSSQKNPFYFHLYLSTYIVTLLTFIFVLQPTVAHLTLSVITWWLVNALFSYFLFRTCRADPGFLPKTENLMRQIYGYLDSGRLPPRVCAYCLSFSALRSKHCTACHRCVAQWDHHCEWTNGCVGHQNHRDFFVMLCCMMVAQIYFVIFSLLHLSRFSGDAGFWNGVGLAYAAAPAVFVVAAFQALMLFLNSHLFIWQFRGVTRALTTSELAHGANYAYLRNGNPFARGSAWRNALMFFTSTYDWRTAFDLEEASTSVTRENTL